MADHVILELTARQRELSAQTLFCQLFEAFDLFSLDQATTSRNRQGSLESLLPRLIAWKNEGSVLLESDQDGARLQVFEVNGLDTWLLQARFDLHAISEAALQRWMDWWLDNNGCGGILHGERDYQFNTLAQVSALESLGFSVSDSETIADSIFPSLRRIDREKRPAHRHLLHPLILMPARRCWFGRAYWAWVAPERLRQFDACESLIEGDDGSFKLVLYPTPDDADLSRERQCLLRQHLGFCEIAHGREVTTRPRPTPPTDPRVEWTEESTRVVRYFVDDQGRPVPKSQATDCLEFPLEPWISSLAS